MSMWCNAGAGGAWHASSCRSFHVTCGLLHSPVLSGRSAILYPQVWSCCKRLSIKRVYLGNTRALLHVRCVLAFLYPQPIESHETRGSAGALPDRETVSRAAWRVAVPKPSLTGRRDPEPRDAWQRWSPTWRGYEIWSRGTCGSAGALLSREAGSGAAGCVAAHGCTLCPLTRLEAGGANIFFPRAALLNFCLGGWSGNAPLPVDVW
jgi:hypothetical protein